MNISLRWQINYIFLNLIRTRSMFHLVKDCVISLITTGMKALLTYFIPALGKEHSLQPSGKRHILISVSLPGRGCVSSTAMQNQQRTQCLPAKPLSSQRNYSLQEKSGLPIDVVFCQGCCWLAAPDRDPGSSHPQPAAGTGLRSRSGLRCWAPPRIALGGSLCAVVEKKKLYFNPVFSKSS